MTRFKPDDYRLSMRLSKRPMKDNPEDEKLRSLLIHRLSDTTKLVIRRGLRTPANVSAYCEPCGAWTAREINDDDLGSHWVCPDCGSRFRVEFAVFEKIEPIDKEDGNA